MSRKRKQSGGLFSRRMEGSIKKGCNSLRSSKAVKFQYIAEYRGTLTRSHLCRLMGVTERGLHAWKHRPPSRRQRRDMVLLAHIRDPLAGRACIHAREAASVKPWQLRPTTDDRGTERDGHPRRPAIARQRCVQTARGAVLAVLGARTASRSSAAESSSAPPTAITPSTSRRISCSRISQRAGRTRNALSWFASKPLPGNRQATSPMSGRGRVGFIWP